MAKRYYVEHYTSTGEFFFKLFLWAVFIGCVMAAGAVALMLFIAWHIAKAIFSK